MVAGFVAVGILPHEPRHVAYVELHLVRFERKEPIQFTDECRAAAEKPGEPVHVVRHEETVVPRRGLGIVAPVANSSNGSDQLPSVPRPRKKQVDPSKTLA